MRVLLVEHESEEAQRMAQGLNEAGYSVEVAANGMVAQRLVEGTEYDLVILDVMLPGLNAWKLQQAIRHKGETPVLFLTSPGGIEDRLRDFVRRLDLEFHARDDSECAEGHHPSGEVGIHSASHPPGLSVRRDDLESGHRARQRADGIA